MSSCGRGGVRQASANTTCSWCFWPRCSSAAPGRRCGRRAPALRAAMRRGRAPPPAGAARRGRQRRCVPTTAAAASRRRQRPRRRAPGGPARHARPVHSARAHRVRAPAAGRVARDRPGIRRSRRCRRRRRLPPVHRRGAAEAGAMATRAPPAVLRVLRTAARHRPPRRARPARRTCRATTTARSHAHATRGHRGARWAAARPRRRRHRARTAAAHAHSGAHWVLRARRPQAQARPCRSTCRAARVATANGMPRHHRARGEGHSCACSESVLQASSVASDSARAVASAARRTVRGRVIGNSSGCWDKG